MNKFQKMLSLALMASLVTSVANATGNDDPNVNPGQTPNPNQTSAVKGIFNAALSHVKRFPLQLIPGGKNTEEQWIALDTKLRAGGKTKTLFIVNTAGKLSFAAMVAGAAYGVYKLVSDNGKNADTDFEDEEVTA